MQKSLVIYYSMDIREQGRKLLSPIRNQQVVGSTPTGGYLNVESCAKLLGALSDHIIHALTPWVVVTSNAGKLERLSLEGSRSLRFFRSYT
jgi:hypothetical protein